MQHDAGIVWLTKIAGLNPATSAVILAWDGDGSSDFELRSALLTACQEEFDHRETACFSTPENACC
jgi:hypothetical protein